MRLFQKKKTVYADVKAEDIRLAALLDHHKIDTVLDIGANLGQYATRLRQSGFTGRIVSFEPLRKNHSVLQSISTHDPKWDIAAPMAVGEENGQIEINVSQNHEMSSILPLEANTLTALPKSKYIGTEKVSIQTLDSLLDEYTDEKEKLFIKADTQGYEFSVLKGAAESIKKNKISGWQLELSLLPLYGGEPTAEALMKWLKDRCFEPHFVLPGYFSKKLMRQLQIDIVFFKAS
ncbi:MAG: FkbM family methyltransferase [Rhodospirillales bacterium]|nr:FkbM family methyltransferase [Alphaproteobacteria bacterium]USO03824.1 MAG: FkbM family methyltransferase [Rhodospirillales bacterium]